MSRIRKVARQWNDQEIVELFLDRVNELAQTKIMKSGGLSVTYNIHYDKETGLTTELQEPDEDDLRSYLITFRQFTSEREPIHLAKMYNLCARLLTDDEFKKNAAEARQHWSMVQEHNGMKLVVNDREYTASEVCDWFINGQYFHSDRDHRAKIKVMEKFPLDRNMFRSHFLNFVIDTSRHIFFLRSLIVYAQQQDKINLT